MTEHHLFGPSSATEWVQVAIGRELLPVERVAVNAIVLAFRTGPYNIADAAAWRRSLGRKPGHPGGVTVYVRGNSLATWDADQLSGLVFAAHDAGVRVGIGQAGPNGFHVSFHLRTRDGSIMRGHPTLEDATAWWRERAKTGTWRVVSAVVADEGQG